MTIYKDKSPSEPEYNDHKTNGHESDDWIKDVRRWYRDANFSEIMLKETTGICISASQTTQVLFPDCQRTLGISHKKISGGDGVCRKPTFNDWL